MFDSDVDYAIYMLRFWVEDISLLFLKLKLAKKVNP